MKEYDESSIVGIPINGRRMSGICIEDYHNLEKEYSNLKKKYNNLKKKYNTLEKKYKSERMSTCFKKPSIVDMVHDNNKKKKK